MPSKHPHNSTSAIPEPRPNPGVVNVILRGLFLLSQRQDAIEVLIPNMGPDHVYRAGDFLSEISLAPRPLSEPYLLFGIEPERKSPCKFPVNENIIFSGFRTDEFATPKDLHARILLPRPFEIISLRQMQEDLEADSDPLGLVHGRNTCCIHVLRYRSSDIDNVHLADHATLRTFSRDGETYVNLHLVSEPDAPFGEHHTRHGFNSLMNLIPGLRGAIQISKIRELLPPKGRPDKGVSDLETCTVREVYAFLQKAGASWRDGQPYRPPVNETAPSDEPPLGCIPLVVDQIPG